MRSRRCCCALAVGAALLVLAVSRPAAAHGGHGGSAGGCLHSSGVISPGLLGVGAGYGAYLVPAIVVVPAALPPPLFATGVPLAGPMPGGGLRGPWIEPPAGAVTRPDPARGARLVTLGDRLFRAGNTRRARDRYEQAARTNPASASPHLRLAQLALVRAEYAEAADQLRRAQAAEPGWLIRAPDVQALFAEPTRFAAQIARLESHLQANPEDRDAWLVLGAEMFLTGRTQKASDVFLRLSDRKPDETLAAFQDASIPRPLEPDR
jgi:tetratricopeptide (TPR) repeat protein